MGNKEASPENPDIHAVPKSDPEFAEEILEKAVVAGRRIIEGDPSHKDSTTKTENNVRFLPVVGRGPDAWKAVMEDGMRKSNNGKDLTHKAPTIEDLNE